jgi:hypothetical protein
MDIVVYSFIFLTVGLFCMSMGLVYLAGPSTPEEKALILGLVNVLAAEFVVWHAYKGIFPCRCKYCVDMLGDVDHGYTIHYVLRMVFISLGLSYILLQNPYEAVAVIAGSLFTHIAAIVIS